jgi:hypothetical protein
MYIHGYCLKKLKGKMTKNSFENRYILHPIENYYNSNAEPSGSALKFLHNFFNTAFGKSPPVLLSNQVA